MSAHPKPRYRAKQSRAARAGLEEPAIETRTLPGGGMTNVRSLGGSPILRSIGDRNQDIRAAGWCPKCKELLAECECGSPDEPGSLFEALE